MRAVSRDSGVPTAGEDDDFDPAELDDFAIHLGMDPAKEQDLMWICRMALKAPVPEGWTAHEDGEGNTYFYNEEKGLSSWEHPSDDFFRVLYQRCKAVESQLSAPGNGLSGSTLVHQELSGQIEVLKKKYAELKESADRVLLENEEFARRAAVSQQELEEHKERHIAEIEALRLLNVKSGSQAAEIPRLEKEIEELIARMRAQEEELHNYKQGVSRVGDDTDKLVEQLQVKFIGERESAKVVRRELDAQIERANEYEGRLAKLQASSLHDKQELSHLRVQAEQEAMQKDARILSLTNEVSNLDQNLKQSSRNEQISRQKIEMMQRDLDRVNEARQKDASEWKHQVDNLLEQVEQGRMEIDKVLKGGSQTDQESSQMREALDGSRLQVASLSQELEKLEKKHLELANSESDLRIKLLRVEGSLKEAQSDSKQNSSRAAMQSEEILGLRNELQKATGITDEALAKVSKLELLKRGTEEALQTSMKEAKERRLSLQVELESAKERLGVLESEIGDARRRAEDYEAQLADAFFLNSQLRETCSRQEDQILKTKAATSKVESSLKIGMESSDRDSHTSQTISVLLSQIEMLRSGVENGEKRVAEISELKMSVDDQLSRAQEKIKKLSAQKEKLDELLMQQSASLTAHKESKLRAQGELHQERQDHQQFVASLKTSLEDSKRQAESHASAYAASQISIRALERRVRDQEDENKRVVERNNKLREDLESSRMSKVKSEADGRQMVLSFSHEIREYQAQLASERFEKKELRTKLQIPNGLALQTDQELIRQCEAAKAGCDKERKGRERLERDIEQMKAERENQSMQYEELCQTHAELKQEASDIFVKYVETEKKKLLAEEQMSEISERNRRLTAYITEDGEHLREQIQTLETEITRLGKERQELARRVASLTDRAEGAEKNVQDFQRDRERMRLQIDRLKGSQLDPRRGVKLGMPQSHVAPGSSLDDPIQRENDEMAAVVLELRQALSSVGPKMREIEVLNNQLQSEAQVVKAQSEGAKQYWQNQIRQRLAELSAAEACIEQMTAEKTDTAREMDRLRNSNESLRFQLEELRASYQKLSEARVAQTTAQPNIGAAGRGIMGLRMRTPAAAYDDFHHHGHHGHRPPLPRAGNPVRPKSKAGFNSRVPSRFAASKINQFMPVDEKIAGLPSPYAAAPRPRTSSLSVLSPGATRPGVTAAMGKWPVDGVGVGLQVGVGGAPASLLSPDVMENLLGLKPPMVGGNMFQTRPYGGVSSAIVPKGATPTQFRPSSRDNHSIIREADLGSVTASGSLVKAYDRLQSQRTALSGVPSRGEGEAELSSVTFGSGLATATPIGQPSGVREVHVDSPAVRGVGRGRGAPLMGVPEMAEGLDDAGFSMQSSSSHSGGIQGNPLVPSGPPPSRPASRSVSRAASSAGGGWGHSETSSSNRAAATWISDAGDENRYGRRSSGMSSIGSGADANSLHMHQQHSSGETALLPQKHLLHEIIAPSSSAAMDDAGCSLGSDAAAMSGQEELAAIVPSSSRASRSGGSGELGKSKKSKACAVM